MATREEKREAFLALAEKIRPDYHAGMQVEQIAVKLGLTRGQVLGIVNRSGLVRSDKVKRPDRKRTKDPEFIEKVRHMRVDKSMSWNAISKELDIAISVVRRCAERGGVPVVEDFRKLTREERSERARIAYWARRSAIEKANPPPPKPSLPALKAPPAPKVDQKVNEPPPEISVPITHHKGSTCRWPYLMPDGSWHMCGEEVCLRRKRPGVQPSLSPYCQYHYKRAYLGVTVEPKSAVKKQPHQWQHGF